MRTRKLIVAAALLLLTAMLCSPVSAAKTFRGAIQGVGPDAVTVMVSTGDIQAFKVDGSTTITRNAELATIESLRVGDAVELTAEMKNLNPHAVTIVAMGKK